MADGQIENPLVSLRKLLVPERPSVIIPCYNEEKTLAYVVNEAKKSWLTKEIIVVDDGSADRSAEIARECGAKLVQHKKNLGKGAAIMSGALAAKSSILVFIDADLENFSHEIIAKLAQPLIENEARFCKSTFEREAGRVTELVAKPLLQFLYPEASLSQPLSGQFAIRKELLLSLDVSHDWGIDISIVLSALKKGERIVEVNIGELKHKRREMPYLVGTAREVTRTILQNAGFLAKKHKLIIFDFDGTLVRGSSIIQIFKSLGMGKRLSELRENFYKGAINEKELTRGIARSLRGLGTGELERLSSQVNAAPYAYETLEYLKRMGYRLAVVSFAFRRVIDSVFPKGYFDLVICPALHVKNDKLTGKVSIPNFKSDKHTFSKGKATRQLLRALRVKPHEAIAIGNAKSDEEMFREVGISIAINPETRIDSSLKVKTLPELLIIAN
ncbi:TPA: HAD-IB family phosphatase [Candidatus Micrarchaeota archaeon]|nr:HAD-IB family phosphatase [Candidatus Micrarchaeota archaeon]